MPIAAAIPSATIPSATILLVDNESRDRKLLQALLQRDGYLTLMAASGDEALAAIRQHTPDLIILDVKMTGIDGFQVAATLKANPATAHIPIILVTGHTERSARLEGLKAGAEEFLTKPIDAAELGLRVRNLLRLKALGDFRDNYNATLEQEVRTRTLELRASELHFRQMAENIRDVFFVVDALSHQAVYISPAFEEIWGIPPDSIYANTEVWSECIHPDDRVSTCEKFTKGMETGIIDFAYRIVRPDGAVRWIEARGFPVRDGDGTLVRVAGVAKDITRSKQAEARIMQLNRIYATLSAINALIVHVRDRAELFSETCRIAVHTGHFAMAWIGTLDAATQDVTPVAWAGAEAKGITRIKRSARSDSPRGAGGVGRAIRELRPVFNNDLAEQGLSGPHLQDILKLGIRSQITLPLFEEQKVVGTLTLYARASNAFDEEERALLTEVAADVSFALAHISKEKKIVRLTRIQAVRSGINGATLHIRDRQKMLDEVCRIAVEIGGFGIAWIGMLNQKTLDIACVAYAGVEAESFLARIQSSARPDVPGGGVSGHAMREKRTVFSNDLAAESDAGDGHLEEALRRGYQSTISLPLLIDGMVAGNFSLFASERDFFNADELKLLSELVAEVSFALEHIGTEDKLVRHNEDLEHKVVARTVDLQRARREAEEANRAKSSFLAAMSHEIRTPMNGVIGMIDVLHQSALQGDQVEMVDLIRDSAFSLLGIINDILDFSKIEAGKLELEYAEVMVSDVVDGVCAMLNGVAEKKDVTLTLYTDPQLPTQVLGDALRLRQVLINLANNAIKFCSGQSRSGRVSVRAILVERLASTLR